MVGAGSQYALAFVDADGRPLSGDHVYRLHVPRDVPVNNFWSVIAYDNQTRSMLQTDQPWPSVTSQDPDFTVNDDGTTDIYFASTRPDDAPNWIQTLPAKGWNIIFRLYGPLDPWFDKTWRLPEIERLS